MATGLLPLATQFIKSQLVPSVDANTTPFYASNAAPVAQDQGWYQMQPGTTQVPQQPSGLLGGIGDFFGDKEKMARLALAFNSMTMRPDAGIQQMALNTLKTAQEQRLLNKQGSATVDYLRKVGRDDLANFVQQNPAFALKAVEIAGQKAPETFNQISGAELNKKIGSNIYEPNAAYNVSSETGKITRVGGGGTNIQVNVPGQKGDIAWEQGAAGALAKRFEGLSNQGDVASSLMPELQALQQLSTVAPTGALVGRLAEAFPGFSSAGDAFTSIISRVAPKNACCWFWLIF